MEFKDYYQILGVDADANSEQIKTAYRKLARKYHPDLNSDKGKAEKFKEVAEAYKVLKNPARRAKFDDLRRYGSQSENGFEAPPSWQTKHSDGFQNSGQFNSEFSDFFNSLFGGGFSQSHFTGKSAQQSRGQDVETELAVFLEETLHQQVKTVEYQLPVSDGMKIDHIKKHLNVKIPQGVTDGELIRVKGQGKPGFGGGDAGDLYLHIRVAPHPLFDVQGHDLIITLPLAPWEAALGAKITVPTLEGNINLSISPNSQSGKKMRIKGKGLKVKGETGDLYAILKIIMPAISNDKANNLWRELAKLSEFDPRSEWSKGK